jgi:hypothetical protein
MNRRIAIVRIVVSFVLVVIGVYLTVLNRGESQTIGSALLSGVMGYWLK